MKSPISQVKAAIAEQPILEQNIAQTHGVPSFSKDSGLIPDGIDLKVQYMDSTWMPLGPRGWPLEGWSDPHGHPDYPHTHNQ